MHVTVAAQIIEYSLINNSCMSVHSEGPVEIRGRGSVLLVGGFFLYRKLIHAEGIISFRIVQLDQRLVNV